MAVGDGRALGGRGEELWPRPGLSFGCTGSRDEWRDMADFAERRMGRARVLLAEHDIRVGRPAPITPR